MIDLIFEARTFAVDSSSRFGLGKGGVDHSHANIRCAMDPSKTSKKVVLVGASNRMFPWEGLGG